MSRRKNCGFRSLFNVKQEETKTDSQYGTKKEKVIFNQVENHII